MKTDNTQPSTFSVTTLGCKVNQYESEALAAAFEVSGYVEATGNQGAALCIVNTCAVTHKAAMQSRQAVRQAVRSNPNARIVVTGCYAQTHPEEIGHIAGVHAIVGHAEKSGIPGLGRALEEKAGHPRPAWIGLDIKEQARFEPVHVIPMGRRARPFVKIQDGCDAVCSYCIVPRARGRSRSLPPEVVIDHLKELKSAGYHEAVLTGIHLGDYGAGLTPPVMLQGLLKRIEAHRAIGRIRLSAVEPRELTDDLIEFAAVSDEKTVCICRHFHIPLQSGDDGILKRMRRPYNRAYFMRLTAKIIKAIPDAAIGVDVMVGFPGETEQAFESTYQLLQSVPVAYFHVFPFSPRSGTVADRMGNRVEPKVIRQRSRKMRALGHEKRVAFYNRSVGTKSVLVVEKKLKGKGTVYKGISDNYIPVLIRSGEDLTRQAVRATITRVDRENRVWGDIEPPGKGVHDDKRV